MELQLSDEQKEIRSLVRSLARNRIAPTAAETDASGRFTDQNRELLAEHDILALPFPERYGGPGTDTLSLLIAIEELSAACATTGLILSIQALGSFPFMLAGSEAQREQWFPALARGEILPALCLTEPGAGSDVAAVGASGRERLSDQWNQAVHNERRARRLLRRLRENGSRCRPPGD
jgi:alkylation response protein AidB-like acyl-CoA dehydrogenase